MKKLHFLLAALAIISFSACKKNSDPDPVTPAYTCTTCHTTPDAIAANNSISKGIYKGVEIGSSGTIMFNIANNDTTITAVMVIDGITVNLVSATPWAAGLPFTGEFTGLLNALPVTINFAVGSGGDTPRVTSMNIPGHPNASLDIIKETSDALIECFEGTYSTTLPETGTLNIILSRTLSVWGGVSRKTGNTVSTSSGEGTISNNSLIDPANNNRVVGVLSGDNLNGSFVDNNGVTITITGHRTL